MTLVLIQILVFLFATIVYFWAVYSLITALYHAWKHKIVLTAGSGQYRLYRQPKRFWFGVITQVLMLLMMAYTWIVGLLRVVDNIAKYI